MVETRRSSAAAAPAGKRPPPSAASIRGKKRPKVRSFPTALPVHAADPPTGPFASSPERISTPALTPRGCGTAETELPRNLRAQSSQTTSADTSSIAVASILASLSVLENNLAVPLMASNVKNVQQGRDIPSLPSGCDASGSCSPDNDTNCHIGKEYSTSEFDLGENVFKVCKDHREIPQNLGSPTLPSLGCQAFNDAFEPGICSTSDIQASVDTHRRQSETMSSDSGTSKSSSSESSGAEAPKKKIKVIVEDDGSVVGEYSKQWSTRTGHIVRDHIPISYAGWKLVPKNLKDKVWNALMDEFELDVPAKVARPLIEKSWSSRLLTFKKNLRRAYLKNDDPLGSKPNSVSSEVWRMFVENESDPKKIEQRIRATENRKKLKISHCLGRRSYAQTGYRLQQAQPEKEITRLDKWYEAHRRSDGTVLESAKSKYNELKALERRRKEANMNGEISRNTCVDLDDDELAEVFGKDKRGRVRAVGSHTSKQQLIHLGVAKVKSIQNKKATPASKLGSSSDNRPSHLFDNLDNVFTSMGASHHPQPGARPAENRRVILLDKYSNELAKGYLVKDTMPGVCDSKQLGIGEKKIYVEEVIKCDARLWDPPQGGHDTLAGYVDGGFLIWLECWLKYI